MLWNGRDTNDPRDWEPCPLTDVDVYAREHPNTKVTVTFLDNDKRTYAAIRAVEIISSRMNCGTIKSVVCVDKVFEGMLHKLNELI